MIKRSAKCSAGKHAGPALRGVTVSSINNGCAGYAGAEKCECSCHEKKEVSNGFR